ncbi:MAG: glycoside hydrolase family 3 N-terminal domain-containing protein [Bacteroidota bacterium]
MTKFKSVPLILSIVVLTSLVDHRASVAIKTGTISPLKAASPHESPAGWVEETLRRLPLEEKIAQMIMPRAFGNYFSAESEPHERLERLVRSEKVGGFVFFKGDVYETALLINHLQSLADIPLLIAADMERGVAMRIRRATIFPDAMAVGAAGEPGLARAMGKAIAQEGRALGIHQNYAPVVDLNNNPKNPVINVRSFGEDPNLVSGLTSEFIAGLHEGRMISTAKHFPGHGDTEMDSHLGIPIMNFSRARLDSLELVPFKGAIGAGVKSVMIAHLGLPNLDTSKVPASLSRVIVQDLLINDLGYKGLIVTDALEMSAVVEQFSVAEIAVRAVKAGSDVLLLPVDAEHSIRAIATAVRRGEILEQRIDASVRKILEQKVWLGLPINREVDIRGIATVVGSRANQALAKDIARQSITVVKNEEGILPLQQHSRLRITCVVISDVADYRTESHRASNPYPNERVGDYFISELHRRGVFPDVYRVDPGSDRSEFNAILTSAKSAGLLLCPAYVRLRTGTGKIGLPDSLRMFLQELTATETPAVFVSFGNPYVIADVPDFQATLCAYSDNELSVEAVAEALFGEIAVAGKLPITIPGAAPSGTGLDLPRVALREDAPERVGFDRRRLTAIDGLIKEAIRDSAFPSAVVLVAKDGVVVHHKAYGTYDYSPYSRLVGRSTAYDLASLTKVIVTTNCIMNLVDEGSVHLDSTVAHYIPEFAQNGKHHVTVRNLLLHNSGLPAYRRYFLTSKSPQQVIDSIYASQLEFQPGDSTLYSDLGMITLAKLIERVTGQSLDRYAGEQFFQPLGMRNTMYNPPSELVNWIAPTEFDTLWRKILIRGRVHDENADALGGVSGHAGLFSTAGDLATLMQMILNGGTYGGRRYLSDSTVEMFTSPQRESPRSLGWDRKSKKGYTSAGKLFSDESFGHTGFTGTSIWVDPKRNLFVILLTNRVHPTRANRRIFGVRPALHEAVIRALRVQ